MIRFLIFILCCIYATSFALKEDKSTKIQFFIGNVQFAKKNQITREKLSLKTLLYPGDQLFTKLESRVELLMYDGSLIKVGENSLFKIDEMTQNKQKSNMAFGLSFGRVWAKFKKVFGSGSSREIKTPTAVVAVRGTEFGVEVNPQTGKTTIRVKEGKVAVTNRTGGSEVLVEENQQTSIDQSGETEDPTEYQHDEANEMNSETDEGSGTNNIPIETDSVVVDSVQTGTGETNEDGSDDNNDSDENDPGTGIDSVGVGTGNNGDDGGDNSNNSGTGLGTDSIGSGNTGGNTGGTTGSGTGNSNPPPPDNLKPEIKVKKNLNGKYTTERNYVVTGSVFDQTPDDEITVNINGESAATIKKQGSFRYNINLIEGTNTITVQATDKAGNAAVQTEELFLDTNKPKVQMTSGLNPIALGFATGEKPPPVPKFKSFTRTVRGFVIDPEPSSGIKRVLINGQEIAIKADKSFEKQLLIPLNQIQELKRSGQPYVIILEVEDMAGNRYRDQSIRITIR